MSITQCEFDMPYYCAAAMFLTKTTPNNTWNQALLALQTHQQSSNVNLLALEYLTDLLDKYKNFVFNNASNYIQQQLKLNDIGIMTEIFDRFSISKTFTNDFYKHSNNNFSFIEQAQLFQIKERLENYYNKTQLIELSKEFLPTKIGFMNEIKRIQPLFVSNLNQWQKSVSHSSKLVFLNRLIKDLSSDNFDRDYSPIVKDKLQIDLQAFCESINNDTNVQKFKDNLCEKSVVEEKKKFIDSLNAYQTSISKRMKELMIKEDANPIIKTFVTQELIDILSSELKQRSTNINQIASKMHVYTKTILPEQVNKSISDLIHFTASIDIQSSETNNEIKTKFCDIATKHFNLDYAISCLSLVRQMLKDIKSRSMIDNLMRSWRSNLAKYDLNKVVVKSSANQLQIMIDTNIEECLKDNHSRQLITLENQWNKLHEKLVSVNRLIEINSRENIVQTLQLTQINIPKLVSKLDFENVELPNQFVVGKDSTIYCQFEFFMKKAFDSILENAEDLVVEISIYDDV